MSGQESNVVRMRLFVEQVQRNDRAGISETWHRHARHDEGFYVVCGMARFTVGETAYDAPAGTLVMVPPGAPHTFANPTDATTVVLNTFTRTCTSSTSGTCAA